MKNNIRQMIKNVIEENAVTFKEQTGKVLYTKVGQKLQEQYKTVAKQVFSKKEKE